MRQFNIAQQCANAIAAMRDCAQVVGNDARTVLHHLLHALVGTWNKSGGSERPEIYSWSLGWYSMSSTRLVPVTFSKPNPTTGKFGS